MMHVDAVPAEMRHGHGLERGVRVAPEEAAGRELQRELDAGLRGAFEYPTG